MAPGGEPWSRAEWAELVGGWFLELVDAHARNLTFPAIDGHRATIGEMLKSDTVATVQQRLRDEAGLAVWATSFLGLDSGQVLVYRRQPADGGGDGCHLGGGQKHSGVAPHTVGKVARRGGDHGRPGPDAGLVAHAQ